MTVDPKLGADDREEWKWEIRLVALAIVLYLVLVGAGSVVGSLLLLGSARSSDLREVAALALLGGALGATVRSIWEAAQLIEEGWELPDGTVVTAADRRAARARAQAEKELGVTVPTPTQEALTREIQERRRRAPGHGRGEADPKEQEQALLEVLEDIDRDARWANVFGVWAVPSLLILPFVGAALGLIAFAGVVGGFLIATGSRNPDYSPAGILFIAVLAGMFAENFIGSLGRGADAIFGSTTPSKPGPGDQR